MLQQLPFRNVVVADFEFHSGGHVTPEAANRAGRNPRPVCLAAKELRTGQTWRVWHDEFGKAPPFPTDNDTVLVAYFASAELSCFRALGWPMPANVLDLFVEFRNRTNGLETPSGSGLIGAQVYFGLDHIEADEKSDLRALILAGGPWDADERKAIQDYCHTDIDALEQLLPAMLGRTDVPRALLRGRYMAAVSAMETNGIPIDMPTLARLRAHWTAIQDDLIAVIDKDYGVFDGRTFKMDRWVEYLQQNNIAWPSAKKNRMDTGRMDMTDNAFRQMAKANPLVAPIRELRSALSDLRLNDLAVGEDGRNRTLLSPFRSRTGRNQPSNSRSIFGPSTWLRSLIKPPPGHGVAYIDWSQQEFGIAAALSGDSMMQAAYKSGDPYLAFAKQAGAVPIDATKKTHGPTRELFKACVLAVQYGMEAESLAERIGEPVIMAKDLMRAHKETYRKFWTWSDRAVDFAMLTGSLHTVFGWTVHVDAGVNPRSLRNFPMQANGAEMLRLACCLATERGIEVCAPIHDAILICAPLPEFEHHIAATRRCMAEASRIVLDGFELGTDVNRVLYPNRYSDPRGEVMWRRVMTLIANKERPRQ